MLLRARPGTQRAPRSISRRGWSARPACPSRRHSSPRARGRSVSADHEGGGLASLGRLEDLRPSPVRIRTQPSYHGEVDGPEHQAPRRRRARGCRHRPLRSRSLALANRERLHPVFDVSAHEKTPRRLRAIVGPGALRSAPRPTRAPWIASFTKSPSVRIPARRLVLPRRADSRSCWSSISFGRPRRADSVRTGP